MNALEGGVFKLYVNKRALLQELSDNRPYSLVETNYIDTVILFDDKLPSVVRLRSKAVLGEPTRFFKRAFRVLERDLVVSVTDDVEVSSEEYYDLLLGVPNVAMTHYLGVSFSESSANFDLRIMPDNGLAFLAAPQTKRLPEDFQSLTVVESLTTSLETELVKASLGKASRESAALAEQRRAKPVV